MMSRAVARHKGCGPRTGCQVEDTGVQGLGKSDCCRDLWAEDSFPGLRMSQCQRNEVEGADSSFRMDY